MKKEFIITFCLIVSVSCIQPVNSTPILLTPQILSQNREPLTNYSIKPLKNQTVSGQTPQNITLKASIENSSSNLTNKSASSLQKKQLLCPIFISSLENSSTNSTNTTVKGKQNLIVGQNNLVAGQANIVIGEKVKILGNANAVSGNANVMVGSKNLVRGQTNYIIGNSNVDSGSSNLIKGSNNKIDGNWSEVVGQANKVKGNVNEINGSNNTVNGNGNRQVGKSNKLAGENNTIEGNLNNVKGYTNSLKGDSNIVTGKLNIIDGNNSKVIGDKNIVISTLDFNNNSQYLETLKSSKILNVTNFLADNLIKNIDDPSLDNQTKQNAIDSKISANKGSVFIDDVEKTKLPAKLNGSVKLEFVNSKLSLLKSLKNPSENLTKSDPSQKKLNELIQKQEKQLKVCQKKTQKGKMSTNTQENQSLNQEKTTQTKVPFIAKVKTPSITSSTNKS